MSPRRILVCDDHSHITRVIELTLRKEGFEVVTAADAESAWDMICSTPPDLLITDHDLPGMNGIELCQLVRSRHTSQQLPILLLTARAFELQEATEVYDLEIATIVMKPFSPLELRAIVTRAFTLPVQHGTATVDRSLSHAAVFQIR